MLDPRWSKVLRDLWGNKARTILVVVSIAVGVLAVGMVAGAQEVFTRGLRGSWAAVNPPNVTLYTWPFDDELLWTIRKMPEVKEVDARLSVYLRFKTSPDAPEWRNMQLYTYPDYKNIRVYQIKPIRGAWPPPAHEVLIERSSWDWMGVKEGDLITVEAPNGTLRQLRVAGTVHDASQMEASWMGAGIGFIDVETLDWLGVGRNFNELNIIVAGDQGDKAHIAAVAEEVGAKVEKTGRQVNYTWIPNPGEHPAEEVIQPILLLMGALGFLSLLLSGFLVVNTLQALLAQQVRQIGIMKAVGAANGQIVGVYYGMVAVFCILAMAIGIPLGVAGARSMSSYMAAILNFDVGDVSLPWSVLGLQVAVGLLIPILAAFYPIFSGVRIPAREAMSSYGLSQAAPTNSRFGRVLGLVQGTSRPLLLSLRNTFRRKGRLALTMTTLVLAGAIFMGVFSVRASLLLTLEDMFAYVDYDALVVFRHGYRIDQLEGAALQVPGVTAAEAWRFSSARRIRPDGTQSDNINLRAPNAESKLVHPKMVEGRWLVSQDENAVVVNTFMLKNEPDLQVGKDIVLKLGEQKTTWHVVGIIKGTPPVAMMYVNQLYLAKLEGGVGRAGVVFVTTAQHSTTAQAAIAKALEQQYEGAGIQVSNTQTSNTERTQAGAQFDVLIMFLLVMAVLLAVVGGIGLMGTMSLNVLERTREIGIMRAIGAADGSVLQIVVVEGMLIGLMSWVLAAILAFPISKALSDAVGNAIWRSSLTYTYSLQGALLWLAAVTVLAGLASAWPARNATRVTVRDVLAYE